MASAQGKPSSEHQASASCLYFTILMRVSCSERGRPMWCFQGKMNNGIGCAVGSLCVTELLRKGLKVLWDTAILGYLVMYIGPKDSLV